MIDLLGTSRRRMEVSQCPSCTAGQSLFTGVKIGNPLEDGVLCGPLHTPQAVEDYKTGIEAIKQQGGKVVEVLTFVVSSFWFQILCGGEVLPGPGNWVSPTIVAIDHSAPIVQVTMRDNAMYQANVLLSRFLARTVCPDSVCDQD